MAADSAGTVDTVGRTTAEVGRIFGESGTDGLILYALILATFLMFLAVVSLSLLLRRTLTSLDTQAKSFIEASQEVAAALKELAAATSASSAGAQSHQLSVANVLSRLELELSTRQRKESNHGPTG